MVTLIFAFMADDAQSLESRLSISTIHLEGKGGEGVAVVSE